MKVHLSQTAAVVYLYFLFSLYFIFWFCFQNQNAEIWYAFLSLVYSTFIFWHVRKVWVKVCVDWLRCTVRCKQMEAGRCFRDAAVKVWTSTATGKPIKTGLETWLVSTCWLCNWRVRLISSTHTHEQRHTNSRWNLLSIFFFKIFNLKSFPCVWLIPSEDHWLGLDKVFSLTKDQTRKWILRVDLYDHEGGSAFAEYENFSLGNEGDDFKLHVGTFQGNAGIVTFATLLDTASPLPVTVLSKPNLGIPTHGKRINLRPLTLARWHL